MHTSPLPSCYSTRVLRDSFESVQALLEDNPFQKDVSLLQEEHQIQKSDLLHMQGEWKRGRNKQF